MRIAEIIQALPVGADLRSPLIAAEKFDLGQIDLLADDPFAVYGRDLREAGLLSLPYDLTYIERQVQSRRGDRQDQGILLINGPGGFGLKNGAPIAADDEPLANAHLFLGTVDQPDSPMSEVALGLIYNDHTEWLPRYGLSFDPTPGLIQNNRGENIILFCLGVLLYPHTQVSRVEHSEKLQIARRKRGKPPLFSYSTVRIAPFRADRSQIVTGAGRAAPRAHWRRGHLRRLRTAAGDVQRTIVIPPTLVGDITRGFVQHDHYDAHPVVVAQART